MQCLLQPLSEFEQSRWNSILGATFDEYTVTGNATPTPSSTVRSYTVKDNSPYFQWHEESNDVPTWGSTTVTTVGSTQEQITYATDTVENGALPTQSPLLIKPIMLKMPMNSSG